MKPVLVFNFKGIPSEEDKLAIERKIDKIKERLGEEYHLLVIFDCKETKIELLTKGRHHKTIKKINDLLKII